MDLYAEIILNNEALEIDRPFTYRVPKEFKEKIKVGQIVKVPFGFRSNLVEGFIVAIKEYNKEDINFKVKDIVTIMSIEPIITLEDLNLISFLREKYLCKYIDAFRLLIPVGILKGAKNKSKSVIVFIREEYEDLKNPDGYKDVIDIIKSNSGKFTKSELVKNFALSAYKINKLIEVGVIKSEEESVARYNVRAYNKDSKKALTKEQSEALESIRDSNKNLFLIKGVTGSGKTEVYMRLVEQTLDEGRSAIVLVPEISLTPQMIERFKGRFGRDVALYHSRLSDGERFDEWFRVKEGKARLIVGARSALFLPAKNLGLIIIDEEHENTYKSEQNPKYQAKEVAEYIANNKGCKLVLGTATPTIETYYRALSGELQLIELNNRVDLSPLPPMELVDMREELRDGNKSLFSKVLLNNIQEALARKEQIILFLNRRGFSTFVSCRSCGYVFKCVDCDISTTYHKNGFLICHYCGKTSRVPKTCPKCSSTYVKFFGAGTERVEDEVKKFFKDANIIRMDVDTTRTKDSHERLYNIFKSGKADILIGTQMISKGLDFPNVTLVGVLAADMSINIPDFRSAERTFQLITQVAGRAGRGEKEGKVIIQAYTPEHYTLQYAKAYDYEEFYNKEFTIRARMNYPPFGKILLINGTSKNGELLEKFMRDIAAKLKDIVDNTYKVEMLGPIPCLISKIKENFRWQIVIKGEFELEFAKKIRDILYENNKNHYNDIRIGIDINPNNLI